MAQAETLLAPEEPYFNGVFILPKRKGLGIWMQASVVQDFRQQHEQPGGSEYLASIFADRPKVEIVHYRLRNANEAIATFLKDRYCAVIPHIFVLGDPPPAGEGEELAFPLEAELLFGKEHRYLGDGKTSMPDDFDGIGYHSGCDAYRMINGSGINAFTTE